MLFFRLGKTISIHEIFFLRMRFYIYSAGSLWYNSIDFGNLFIINECLYASGEENLYAEEKSIDYRFWPYYHRSGL